MSPRRLSLAREVALAFAAGAGAFALVAVILAAAQSDALAVVLGIACLAAVVAAAQFLGIAYAAPVAMAGLLAFDWYQFPPTHPHEIPDSGNLLDLLAYLWVAVLVGQLAAHSSRRADTSERARSELAQEQAALRRVATLVAQAVPPGELFEAATAEAGALLGADLAALVRVEGDYEVTVVATWAAAGEHPDVGTHFPLAEGDLARTVLTTGRPARLDGPDPAGGPIAAAREELGVYSSVACPVLVEGRTWGGLAVHSKHTGMLGDDTEARLHNFAELVATALSNAKARDEVERLAEEQAALRRVATLVAEEAPAEKVFAKIAEEVSRLLDTTSAAVVSYESDAGARVVAAWGEVAPVFPVGTRMDLIGDNVSVRVYRTGRPARIDDLATAEGPVVSSLRRLGVRSSVGSPVLVEGQLWGVILTGTERAEPLAADAESRIEAFTELAATAISNIEARSALAESRARVVAAMDEERRRVVRDLHDGAQQRLVHTVVTLKLARRALDKDRERAPALLAEALGHAEQATAELRELAHGILPAVLTHGGLRAGVRALASRMTLPVDIGVTADRLPAAVEATAYFVVAESLTNIAKHAHAEHAAVTAEVEHGTLQLEVRDDGLGGAQPDGSGLLGLADRVAVLDGSLRVESPPGGGTLIAASIPSA
jgi:signal transduction histidine kinase